MDSHAFIAENGQLKRVRFQIGSPTGGQVLVRVRAFGINRADLQQVQGEYNPPPGVTPVLGLEMAGEIIAVGPDSPLKPGQKVMGLVSGGAYSEYCLADSSACLQMPGAMPFEEAAALPEALFTAWLGLIELGRLQNTETLLVQGASGGVGLMACQLGRHFGKEVVSVCSTEEKARITGDWGANQTWVGSSEEIRSQLETYPDSVDVILDYRGASLLSAHMTALRRGGRLVMIEDAEGTLANVDLDTLIIKRLSLIGSVLRSRPASEKAELARALNSRVIPLLETGVIKATVSAIFSPDRVAEAHNAMAARRHWGKLVVRWE